MYKIRVTQSTARKAENRQIETMRLLKQSYGTESYLFAFSHVKLKEITIFQRLTENGGSGQQDSSKSLVTLMTVDLLERKGERYGTRRLFDNHA